MPGEQVWAIGIFGQDVVFEGLGLGLGWGWHSELYLFGEYSMFACRFRSA